MSCIIGIVQDGTVWMGADGALTTGDGSRYSDFEGKMFLAGPFLIGAVGSIRACQILRYGAQFTKPTGDFRLWLYKFANACRERMADNVNPEEGDDIQLLIAHKGRIFQTAPDFAFFEREGVAAIGAGCDCALGYLDAADWALPVEDLIRGALECAARHNAFIGPPYTVMSLPKNTRRK